MAQAPRFTFWDLFYPWVLWYLVIYYLQGAPVRICAWSTTEQLLLANQRSMQSGVHSPGVEGFRASLCVSKTVLVCIALAFMQQTCLRRSAAYVSGFPCALC